MKIGLYTLSMMWKSQVKTWVSAGLLFLVMTLLIGVVYTGVCTGIAQLVFPEQANGSIVEAKERAVGSTLVAQPFAQLGHLWGRQTVLDTDTFADENGTPLLWFKPSNISPASDEFSEEVAKRVIQIRAANPEMRNTPIPSDLVTNSGSGFDPHISSLAAQYQVKRLVSETGKSTDEIRAIIEACTEPATFGVLGQERVNVLKVNLMLDGKDF